MAEPTSEQLEDEGVARTRSRAPEAEGRLGETYRRIRRIGSGGMADVYEVEHVRLEARFAAKVLRPGSGDQASARRRFLREARVLARLRSEHIVQVFDVSDETADPFYVMELLDGVDLRELIVRNERLSIERAARIVRDACGGLAVVHAARLVHRDLKPENLFITHRDNGEDLCKLLDFGVSKGSGPTTTETGALIGTVSYMAPEQVDSAGAVTARSDVYSLGAILYELLAGRPPHVADSVERLLFSILTARPVPLAELRPEVPGELCDVVHRALSSDPEQRFATARDLADALGRFAKPEAGVATLRASSPVVAARKLAGSRTWALRSVAALLAGVALAALGLARSLPRGTTHAAAKPAAQPVAALIAAPKPALPAAEPAEQAFSPSARALPPRESASPVVMPEPASARHSTASQQSNATHPRAARPTISTPKHEASMDADMPLPKIQFVLANPYEH